MGTREDELNIFDRLILYIENLSDKYIQDIDEYYYDLLEKAIEYGMTPKQFWEEDIELFYCYRNAYIKRTHTQCHIQGLYNNIALSVTLNNILSDKKDKAEYPNETLYDMQLEKIKDENDKKANIIKQNKITKNISKENLEEQYRLRLANCY